jgi:hypothetical protein
VTGRGSSTVRRHPGRRFALADQAQQADQARAGQGHHDRDPGIGVREVGALLATAAGAPEPLRREEMDRPQEEQDDYPEQDHVVKGSSERAHDQLGS